jgi:hypothetical protein
MRRYVLLLMLALVSCSRPDFDTSVQVEAWLRSLDPNAEVIEVWCKGNVEEPPGSGTWKQWDYNKRLPASEVLAGSKNLGLDWDDILTIFVSKTRRSFPSWVLGEAAKKLTAMDFLALKMSFRVEDLHCDGKPLRSPPIQIGKCPNDLNGCDEPPMPTNLPPLPPPDPGGGGDF